MSYALSGNVGGGAVGLGRAAERQRSFPPLICPYPPYCGFGGALGAKFTADDPDPTGGSDHDCAAGWHWDPDTDSCFGCEPGWAYDASQHTCIEFKGAPGSPGATGWAPQNRTPGTWTPVEKVAATATGAGLLALLLLL